MVRSRVSAALFVLCGLMIIQVGCKSDENVFATPNASIGGGDTAVDPTAGFKLTLKAKTGVSALMHKFGDYAAICEISKTAPTPTALHCLLNVMEYDLFFYGFDIQLSVPAGFCSFLEETPYRYFKGEPGYGPTTMNVTTVDGIITVCNVDGAAGTISAATGLCTSGEVVLAPNGEKRCQYDYSNYEVDGVKGPNCCFGTGTLNVVTTVNGAGGPETTASSSKVTWGGSLSSCTESPHDFVETWPLNTAKMALTRVTELGDGPLAVTTKFPSVFKLYNDTKRTATRAVYLHANMFDWARYQTAPTTWSMTTASVPRAFNPVKDRGAVLPTNRTANGSDFSTPSFGQYQYRCLGPAGELKHSINLWVQSWNTKEEYDAYTGSGNYAAADPYVQGTAGVDCEAVSDSISCNSFWSFEDLFIQEGASNPLAYEFPFEFLRGSPP